MNHCLCGGIQLAPRAVEVVVQFTVAWVRLDLAGDLRPVCAGGHQTYADCGEESVTIAGTDGLLGHRLGPTGDVADGLRPDRATQPAADRDRAQSGMCIVELFQDLADTERDPFVGSTKQMSPTVPKGKPGEDAARLRVEHRGTLPRQVRQHPQAFVPR